MVKLSFSNKIDIQLLNEISKNRLLASRYFKVSLKCHSHFVMIIRVISRGSTDTRARTVAVKRIREVDNGVEARWRALFLPTNEPGDKLLWNRSLTLVYATRCTGYMLESRIHLISFLEILPRYRDTFRNVCFDLYFDILRCTTENTIPL